MFVSAPYRWYVFAVFRPSTARVCRVWASCFAFEGRPSWIMQTRPWDIGYCSSAFGAGDWGCLRSGHTLRDCHLFAELSNSLKEEKQREAKRARGTAQPPAPNTEEQYPLPHGRVCMIQEGR